MKKFSGTWIALAVFGGLLVWLFWLNPKSKDEREEASKTVVKAEREKIDRIELVNAAGTFVFEKKGGAWEITSPIAGPAEDVAMSQMLNALSQLIATTRVYEKPTEEQRKQAGLEPALTTVKFRADGKEQTLLVGKPHSREESYYVSTPGGAVFMGRKWSLDVFGKGLDEFRRKKLFVFDKDDVRNLWVGDVELSRADALAPWHTNGKPFEGRADRGKVNGLVTKLQNLRAKAWLGADTKLETKYEIAVGLANGDRERLFVGQAAGADEWLARTGTSGEIVVTSGPRPLDDPKEIASWRDPQLYDFVVDDVSKLEVEVDGQTITVTRDAEQMWKAGGNVVNPEATTFLRDAKLAKAVETSGAPKGTDRPVVKATWVTPTETMTLLLGDPQPGTKPVQRWIRTHETKGAVLVQEDFLSHARALKEAASRVPAATSTTSAGASQKGSINVTVDKGT